MHAIFCCCLENKGIPEYLMHYHIDRLYKNRDTIVKSLFWGFCFGQNRYNWEAWNYITLFNIVEVDLKNSWTLMSELYNDIHMYQ